MSHGTYVNGYNPTSNGGLNRTEKSISRIKRLAGNDICADCKSKGKIIIL